DKGGPEHGYFRAGKAGGPAPGSGPDRGIPATGETEEYVFRCVVGFAQPPHRPRSRAFQPDGGGDGAAEFQRSELAEHSDQDGPWARDSAGVCGGKGTRADIRRLLADRTEGPGALLRREGAAGGVRDQS